MSSPLAFTLKDTRHASRYRGVAGVQPAESEHSGKDIYSPFILREML